jgi:DNA polymerase-3 subunit delta'
MTFAAINGHAQQKDLLRRAIENDRIAHAYLFTGPEGIGKRLTALAFAKALLCTEGCGCGACSACRKVDHNNHPDVHIVNADGTSIKIEQIRALQQQLSLRPLEGRYRFCLIDDAELLTIGAGNALLKTLEEPQPQTVIVLVSSQGEKLLTTIRSRCQQLNFSRLPRAEVAAILKQQLNLDDTQAQVLAALSEGSFKKGLGQDRELFLKKRRELIHSLSALSPGSNIQTLEFAEEISVDKEILPNILDIFQAFYRDLLLLKQGRPESELVNIDLLETLTHQLQHVKTADLLKKLEALTTARYHLQRNVNRQLTLEVMLLQMAAC